MDLLPNCLPYEIKLEIFKYTNIQTCLKLNIKDDYLLDYLYKKSGITCYKDIEKYNRLQKNIIDYMKNSQNLKLKHTDFIYSLGKITLNNNLNQCLIEYFNLDKAQLHNFEKLFSKSNIPLLFWFYRGDYSSNYPVIPLP
jgi:hypothetical protein